MKRCVEELGCVALGNDRNLFAEKLDILAPCALGGILDHKTIQQLKCQMVCGTANNQLLHPDADGALLKQRGILYAPDFIANAGGLIRLGGLYVGLTEKRIDDKVAAIEDTTLAVFKESSHAASTSDAAIAYAKRRIESVRKAKANAQPVAV
jgi:leucine dehydrogenase